LRSDTGQPLFRSAERVAWQQRGIAKLRQKAQEKTDEFFSCELRQYKTKKVKRGYQRIMRVDWTEQPTQLQHNKPLRSLLVFFVLCQLVISPGTGAEGSWAVRETLLLVFTLSLLGANGALDGRGTQVD
jgi:hypothetical protein